MIKRRKPWLAALLSFLCPGVGQLYNGNLRWALAAFPIGIVISLVSSFYLADSFQKLLTALAIGFVFDIVFAVQAYREARRLGEVPLQKYQRWWAYIGFAVLLYGVPDGYGTLYPERFLSFQIPSESMVPNLLIGDRLVADGWAYQNKEPQRGDVIVFKYPRDESIVYVKRLVGLPGDTVELKDGELFINGELQPQVALGAQVLQQGWAFMDYREKLGQKEHVLRRAVHSSLDNFGPVTVPSDKFFAMGDNRDRSADSRAWGFVSREQLLGRMSFIYFSWDAENKRIRTERSGIQIH